MHQSNHNNHLMYIALFICLYASIFNSSVQINFFLQCFANKKPATCYKGLQSINNSRSIFITSSDINHLTSIFYHYARHHSIVNVNSRYRHLPSFLYLSLSVINTNIQRVPKMYPHYFSSKKVYIWNPPCSGIARGRY